MLRYLSILFVLVSFGCSTKPSEPLADRSSTSDASPIIVKNDSVNTYLHTLAPVKGAARVIQHQHGLLKNNKSLYQCLKELREKDAYQAKITNSRDTILELPLGTRLLIPANAFQTKSGNANVVKINVQEYYSLIDMVSANLTTITKDNILETGGMIYINASSNEQECVLNSGKEIEINFPFTVSKPEMQLFTGTRNRVNEIVWEPLPVYETELEQSDYTFSVAEHMPEFPGGYEALIKYINKNVKYPADARKMGIQGIVYVRFIVDSSGSVINPTILRGVHKSLDRSAVDAISMIPKWKPGRNEGRPVNVAMTFPIRFTLDGIWLSMSSNGSNPYADKQIKDFGENMTDSTLEKSAVEEVSYYILKTSTLGWINCDRFIAAADRITFKVYIPGNLEDELDVKLIFRKIRSILPGDRIGNYIFFSNVPRYEHADILALRSNNGALEMCTHEVRVHSKADSLLLFQPVTVKKLKSYLGELDDN